MSYPKECILKECKEASIRLLEVNDKKILQEFYSSIPEKERWYMRYDITDPEAITRFFDSIEKKTVHSIIALSEDKIIAHASLHLRTFGSTRHVGRLRIMVGPEVRHQRLGTWMLIDLIQLAMELGLSDLRADFVSGIEEAAIDAAFKLDFFEKAELKGYVKNPEGGRHNLIILMKRLHKTWSDF